MAVRSSIKPKRLSWEISSKGSPGGPVGSIGGEADSAEAGVASGVGSLAAEAEAPSPTDKDVGRGVDVETGVKASVEVGDEDVEQPTRATVVTSTNTHGNLDLIS
jgi:hypothetical protein